MAAMLCPDSGFHWWSYSRFKKSRSNQCANGIWNCARRPKEIGRAVVSMDRFRGDETQPGNLKNSWRLIVLVGLAMFLSVTSYAQDGERQEKVKSAPLEIRLQTLVSTLCVGTSTILEMEVINVSRKEIRLDKVDLWSEFTYSYSDPNTTSGRGGGEGSSSSTSRGDVI